MSSSARVRCAIYTRKSSKEGLDPSFNSLHAQREACEAYVLSQRHEGWLVVKASCDDGGFSGGNMDRPGLKRLAGAEKDTIRNFPAVEIERCIIEGLNRFLSDSVRVAEHLPGYDIHTLRRIAEESRQKATLLSKGTASQKHERVKELVTGVVASHGLLRIDVRRTALILTCDVDDSTAGNTIQPILIEEPFTVARRGRESRLILRNSPNITSAIPSLVRVIVQSRTWYEWIIAGEVRTLKELTARAGTARRHTSRILRLAALAPDLAEEILRGEHTPELTVEELTKAVPLEWEDKGGESQRDHARCLLLDLKQMFEER